MMTQRNTKWFAGHDAPVEAIAMPFTGTGLAIIRTSEGHLLRVNPLLVRDHE